MANMIAIDGNEAAARIAHKVSEVIAIYPITPSTNMAEHCDVWSSEGKTNLWGQIPHVVEMQSEAGAAGTLHGVLRSGALSTTFTSSQGLLLMIPNMYKIAGELSPTVFHVAARAIAGHGLTIFPDYSDVFATRQSGFALLCSSSAQEAHDFALISHAATLEARVPFLHFFEGFRVSHEVMKIAEIDEATIRAMIDDRLVEAHRQRALNPDNPHISGTAQNPDVYFQGRETVNRFYSATPAIVQKKMDQFAQLTGREYKLVEYSGAPDAEMVIVTMGTGAKTATTTVEQLNREGYKCGVLNVRLFRPFPGKELIEALPNSVKKIAVLDRIKEPGSAGEPLYIDVATACSQALNDGSLRADCYPTVVGGRFALGGKEFTPAMVKGVFDMLSTPKPRNGFTVGIVDDVTHTSISYDPSYRLKTEAYSALFYGLGSDGTIGANKNTIKIIAESTPNFAQGYFVFDSKKAGSMTVSHLRFGKEEIEAPYLIEEADFIACHHTPFIDKHHLLEKIKEGGIFLFNTPVPAEEVLASLPRVAQETLIEKKVRFYVIDAYKVGAESGMGRRINSIMQACFFAVSGVLPYEEAMGRIKEAIELSYSSKGEEVVALNKKSVDMALANLHEVKVPDAPVGGHELLPPVKGTPPKFVKEVTSVMIAGKGDTLPVSAMPVDGLFPSGTTQWEKRSIALEIPIWSPELCIQCGKCALVCPHAAIRSKIASEEELSSSPAGFQSVPVKGNAWGEKQRYIIQVSPDDCTGCAVCVDACPVVDKANSGRKAINMEPMASHRDRANLNWDFMVNLPEADRLLLKRNLVKDVQLMEPLFEFSGACAGCGETPYVKLVSQLFGDRMVVANASGCSSVYGGNLPTTPWKANREGRGSAWSNSLFEDNAEYGLGIRLALNSHRSRAVQLLETLRNQLNAKLVEQLSAEQPDDERAIQEQRTRVKELRLALAKIDCCEARELEELADYLVRKTVWMMGGDGWAYDIGYGGLDHVLASNANVNILVLDTEVYSNTGGQASKATPTGAVAKFASSGKREAKKDLAMIAMSYGNCYVARVALGANDAHAVKTFLEAEAFDGPSLIIAYCPCIEHGYDLEGMLRHQKTAVKSGYWPLFRYNPSLADQGKSPLQLDSRTPELPVQDYLETENRFRQVARSNPQLAQKLAEKLQKQIDCRWKFLQELAEKPGRAI